MGVARGAVLVVVLTTIGVTATAAAAAAGPQDDPDPPPVTVQAGQSSLLPTSTYVLTLTLEAAVEGEQLTPAQVAVVREVAVHDASPGFDSDSGGDASDGVGPSGVSGGGGAGGECAWRSAGLPAGDPSWGGNDPAAGSLLVNTCNGPSQFLYVPDSPPGAAAAAAPPPPPPPPDPAVLAERAYGELTLPEPVVRRSPSETNSDPGEGGLPFTLVGLHTWVWAAEWQPVQRTVALRGVSATVTATPTRLVFDPGTGDPPVSCPGPGRPWTEADGNDPPPRGGCAYVYRSVTPDGPLTATTSVQWSVEWTSNTGAGGVFPVGSSRSESSFLVEQIQVVVER